MRISRNLLSHSADTFAGVSHLLDTFLYHAQSQQLARSLYFNHKNIIQRDQPYQIVKKSRLKDHNRSNIISTSIDTTARSYNFDFLVPALLRNSTKRSIKPFHRPVTVAFSSRNFTTSLKCRVVEKPKGISTVPLNPLTIAEKTLLDRSFTLHTHGDMILRCTEFDSEGNVVSNSRDFKKTELCTKHGLLPRDLRKLESKVIVPHILIRKNSILVNLLHIRALIKANTVLLFDVHGSTDTYTKSALVYDLGGKLSSKSSKTMGGLPYEMRAMEAILISVMAALESELKVLQDNVVSLLEELEDNIDRDKLRFMLIYSKKLSTFEQKAQLICGAIEEVLEADDDLAGMYLSEKMNGIERPAEEHSEIEMLLESYYKMADEIVQVSGNLVANIKNTEDIVNIILDANRNSLMLLDLKFSIGTLSTGCGAALAALYGMNLKNFIEESDLAFFGVSGLVIVLSAAIFGYGLNRLRRTQRLTMWGEGSIGATPGRKWRKITESRSTHKADDNGSSIH